MREYKKPKKKYQLAHIIEYNEKRAKKLAGAETGSYRRGKNKSDIITENFLDKIMRDRELTNMNYTKRYELKKRQVEEQAAKIIQNWFRRLLLRRRKKRKTGIDRNFSSLRRVRVF